MIMSPSIVKHIFLKELRSFFNSPVAYIVMLVFLVILGWFFTSNLFIANLSSLRTVFEMTPFLLLFFAPAAYWLDLAGYDPATTARSLNVPILVLQGGRDYQVTAKDFDGWKAALAAAPNATFRLFPKLNHLLVEGEGPSTPAEYERPGHVAVEVVEAIAAWARALPAHTSP